MSDRRNNNDRRKQRQRRRSRERRSNLGNWHTVIEIEGPDLRVVTLSQTEDDSKDLVRVFSLRWKIEAQTLNSERGCQELSAALSDLIEKYSIQSSTVQFVLGGEFCVTKAVRGTSEKVRSELQQIEQRSRLYLMLGPGEKVTVSKSQPLDARHLSAVASVCNKQTLDTIHEAATRAGMKIDSIEPALVSTSRAIGRLSDVPKEPCLLIHLHESAVELGVCRDGNLVLDYRPGGRTDPEELVELVRTHRSRLKRHVGRQINEPAPRLNRIYLCGNEQAVKQAFAAFSACEQFQVEIIDPGKIQATWQFEETVHDSAAVPSLGALLSTYLPKNEQNAPNFMEHIVASTREPIKPILLRSAVPLAAVLLIALIISALNLTKQTSINRVQQQLDELAKIQTRERELRLQDTAASAKLVQLRALAAGMQTLDAGKVVARIGQCMPSDVWLDRLEIRNMENIQLDGVSYLESVVFDFEGWLRQAPGFEDVAIRSTRPGHSAAGPAVHFNVELNIGDWEGRVEEVASNE